MAGLFQVTLKTISEHLQNIYDEGEIDPEPTIRKLRIVQIEGQRQMRRLMDHYRLDAILAVGYRVRSNRGTRPVRRLVPFAGRVRLHPASVSQPIGLG
ncbi:MAG: virulence RhuM family protein [Burkholderiaceae bacterium]|nr:virulence RhuM family protein [Burkholderiaceae bacterium]